MELAKKFIPIVIKNLEDGLNLLGFHHISEKFDEYGPYHSFVRKNDKFMEVINIPFNTNDIVYKIIDIYLEHEVTKMTNFINPFFYSKYILLDSTFSISNWTINNRELNFYKIVEQSNIKKDYISKKNELEDEKIVQYLDYVLQDINTIGLPFFEGVKKIDNFILLMDKDSQKGKGLINTENSACAWHIRRILLAREFGDSAFMKQCFKDFEQNLIDWASYTYYNKPDDYVYINYGYEVMKRAKSVIYDNVAIDDLELIPLEVFPKRVTDYSLLYGRDNTNISNIEENMEEMNTQTITAPVGNIDLMGISIVKGYRKDFAEAFIKACETPLYLDLEDEATLADAARDFNSDVLYFAADEAEGWTAITIMAEDIADVMPSIRDEMGFVDEILADLFPNAAVVTLNQYDTVGAYGFAVTEQGQKRRGYFSVEGNEYENYGEPLPEEKEHDSLATAMFHITKRLTGFAFTDKNINKHFQAIKLK